MSVDVVDGCAVLVTVDGQRVWLALTDADGVVRPETMRNYDLSATTGITATLISFQRALGLARLPSRSAVAVAGLVRGDAIAVTHTRWFLSRSGLQSMLGAPPLILNNFAADAWAIAAAGVEAQAPIGRSAPVSLQRPGCYLVMGITLGMGVAVVHRSRQGVMTVLSTEAGHAMFAATDPELAALADSLRSGRHGIAAEDIVSAPGLAAIYASLVRGAGFTPLARSADEVVRLSATDPVAHAACTLLAKAFWAQVGNLVTTFGAWDGVIVSGKLTHAIRSFLERPEAEALFFEGTRYRRVLQDVPRVLTTLENRELEGIAEALRHEGAIVMTREREPAASLPAHGAYPPRRYATP